MNNNKQFKIGDRVRTVWEEGKIVELKYAVEYKAGGYNIFSARQLTLIASTPDVSDEGVKTPWAKMADGLGAPSDFFDLSNTPVEVDSMQDVTLPVSSLKGRPITLKAGQSLTVTYPKKGFNPETLEFDGVKILVGDEVTVNGGDYNVCSRGSLSNDNLSIMYYDEYNLPLTMLNITAHYPAKDKELERLQGELLESENALFNSNHQDHAEYEQCVDSFKTNLHRYDQARKELEEYKSKNK